MFAGIFEACYGEKQRKPCFTNLHVSPDVFRIAERTNSRRLLLECIVQLRQKERDELAIVPLLPVSSRNTACLSFTVTPSSKIMPLMLWKGTRKTRDSCARATDAKRKSTVQIEVQIRLAKGSERRLLREKERD